MTLSSYIVGLPGRRFEMLPISEMCTNALLKLYETQRQQLGYGVQTVVAI